MSQFTSQSSDRLGTFTNGAAVSAEVVSRLLAFVGVEMHRAQVAKTESEVFDISGQWQADAIAKSWSATS